MHGTETRERQLAELERLYEEVLSWTGPWMSQKYNMHVVLLRRQFKVASSHRGWPQAAQQLCAPLGATKDVAVQPVLSYQGLAHVWRAEGWVQGTQAAAETCSQLL